MINSLLDHGWREICGDETKSGERPPGSGRGTITAKTFKPETRPRVLVDTRGTRCKGATRDPRRNNNSQPADSQVIPTPVTVRLPVVKVALKSTKIVHLVPQLLHTVRHASRVD